MSYIDSVMLKQMILSAANHLQNCRKNVDDLNVFPVPDGDTGSNMSRTFTAAAKAAAAEESTSAAKILSVLVTAALRSARGNSGVILSQILRGMARGVDGSDRIGTEELKKAAVSARDTAYRAVMKPTEGTILTVVREIAEFTEKEAEQYREPEQFLQAIMQAGRASLARTPEILPVLKQAGVVDAGGQGVMILLEGACLALAGTPVALAESAEEAVASSEIKTAEIDTANIKYLYCTEFIIHKKANRQINQFSAAIQTKGDCMLVIEDEEIVKVHIHTNHPGFVLEQALKLGELTDLKIDNMKYQHEERLTGETAAEPPSSPAEPLKEYGKVCVSAGSGFSEIFLNLGADHIVEGGQTMNPSTDDLLHAVEQTRAKTVFLLPNNKNIILAAEQVQELTDKTVIVIPTVNMPQGIAAMMAFEEGLDPADNASVMNDMAQSVSCGQVTFAARDSAVGGKEISKGDIIGIEDGEIAVIGVEPSQVCEELLASMVNEESGVISVYYGSDVPKEVAQLLLRRLEEQYSELDVVLYDGGQPVYYYIVSVES